MRFTNNASPCECVWGLRYCGQVLVAEKGSLHLADLDEKGEALICFKTYELPPSSSIKAILRNGNDVYVLYTTGSIYYLVLWTIGGGFGMSFCTGIRAEYYPMQVIHNTVAASVVLFDEKKKPVQFEYFGGSFRRNTDFSLDDLFIPKIDGMTVGEFSYSIHVKGMLYFFNEGTIYELDSILDEKGTGLIPKMTLHTKKILLVA